MKQIVEYKGKTNGTQRYYGIDVVKFFCAFLVVAIHVAPFSEKVFPDAAALNFFFTKTICRIAVPFYFAASGFLLFRNMDRGQVDWERVRNYCFKLLRLYGLWSVLLSAGEKGHLWYLGATVVGVLCLSLCFHRRMKFGVMALFAAVLYGIGLLGDSYYGIQASLRNIPMVDQIAGCYESMFRSTRNGLFMGFPFLMIGAVLGVKKVRMKPLTAALGFTASVALLIAEAYALKHYGRCRDYNMYLSLLPAAFFLLALATSVVLPKRGRYEGMQTMGSLVYYLHLLVYAAIRLSHGAVMKMAGVDLYVYQYLITVLVTTLISALIWKISKDRRFAWLQYLYR